MAKKGVKFDSMSTGQKVVHVLGWASVAGFAMSTIAMVAGVAVLPSMVNNTTSTNQQSTGANGLASRFRR
jgi:hypothetical protein